MIRIGSKVISGARVRLGIRQPTGRRHVWDPIEALFSLAMVPARIDAVARDINSGELVYADIDAWELGVLLGLDWENAPADWSYINLRAKTSLHDAGFERPFAENLSLLNGLVPAERYAELQRLVDDPSSGSEADDLPLTDEEGDLLTEKYAETKAVDAWGLGLARTALVSSDGTCLHFEIVVGDSGDLEGAKGPYQFLKGEFLDISAWVVIG